MFSRRHFTEICLNTLLKIIRPLFDFVSTALIIAAYFKCVLHGKAEVRLLIHRLLYINVPFLEFLVKPRPKRLLIYTVFF